jgi:hypothetical protein
MMLGQPVPAKTEAVAELRQFQRFLDRLCGTGTAAEGGLVENA